MNIREKDYLKRWNGENEKIKMDIYWDFLSLTMRLLETSWLDPKRGDLFSDLRRVLVPVRSIHLLERLLPVCGKKFSFCHIFLMHIGSLKPYILECWNFNKNLSTLAFHIDSFPIYMVEGSEDFKLAILLEQCSLDFRIVPFMDYHDLLLTHCTISSAAIKCYKESMSGYEAFWFERFPRLMGKR